MKDLDLAEDELEDADDFVVLSDRLVVDPRVLQSEVHGSQGSYVSFWFRLGRLCLEDVENVAENLLGPLTWLVHVYYVAECKE